MKIKAIVTSAFAISALGVSGVASANAYDFGTKDTCKVVSCAGQAPATSPRSRAAPAHRTSP